jgi:hypothetical protein
MYVFLWYAYLDKDLVECAWHPTNTLVSVQKRKRVAISSCCLPRLCSTPRMNTSHYQYWHKNKTMFRVCHALLHQNTALTHKHAHSLTHSLTAATTRKKARLTSSGLLPRLSGVPHTHRSRQLGGLIETYRDLPFHACVPYRHALERCLRNCTLLLLLPQNTIFARKFVALEEKLCVCLCVCMRVCMYACI